MPKKISLDKDLVGQIVTQENVKIGLRVEASQNWQYGDQGDYGLGTITAIVNGEEEYGLDYNYVTITWDNDDVHSYPLPDGCLKFSDGKKKKTLISVFLEKAKLWDVFKITNVIDNYGGLTKGMTFQLIEIKNKYITIDVVSDRGVHQMTLDNPAFEKVKFRKQSGFEAKTLEIIDEFADFIETPTFTKDKIINSLKERYKNDIREFLSIHNRYLNEPTRVRVSNVCTNTGLAAENRLYFNTILGNDLELERTDRFYFHIRSNNIRAYIQKHFDGEIKKTYKEWLDFFDNMNNKTVFNDKLRKVILQSNCNEKLKQYFKDGLGRTDENFIDFDRATKKIQFTPKGKTVEIDGNGEPRGVKQTMSPHKYFGKYFKGVEGVGEYDIKCFADEVISTFGEYRVMEIEDGKIGHFYSNLRTITSCMTGKNVNLFRLYDEHPHIFKMFAITLNGEVVGRALRVNAKVAGTDEDFVYFDRLYYGGNEEVVQWFNAYCDTNGLTRKYKNNATDINVFYNKKLGGVFKKRIYVEVFKKGVPDFEHHYNKIPYLDTLRYGMYGVLTNEQGQLTIKDRFKNIPTRYVFDRSDSEYSGKGYKGYCAYQGGWTGQNVVEITEGDEKFIGTTVEERYAKKTETGYTVNF